MSQRITIKWFLILLVLACFCGLQVAAAQSSSLFSHDHGKPHIETSAISSFDAEDTKHHGNLPCFMAPQPFQLQFPAAADPDYRAFSRLPISPALPASPPSRAPPA